MLLTVLHHLNIPVELGSVVSIDVELDKKKKKKKKRGEERWGKKEIR